MRKKQLKVLPFVLMILLVLPVYGTRKMEFTDIFRYRSISSIKPSPDGKALVYLLRESDLNKNSRKTYLWMWMMSENRPLLLVSSLKGISTPSWSPDGKLITFIAEDTGRNQVFYLPVRGEARKLFSFEESIVSYEWLPKGSGIIFVARKPDKERDKKIKKGFDARIMERAEPRLLWFWNKKSGKITHLETSGLSVREFRISPDGKKLALVLTRTPLVNDMAHSEIYLLDLSTSKLKKLTENKIIEDSLRWGRDGKYIYFLSQASENLEPYYQTSIFKLDPETGRIVDLLPGFKHEVHEYFIARDDGKIYFTVNEGVKVNLYSMSEDGRGLRKLTNYEGWIRGISDDTIHGKIFCLFSDPSFPFELHEFDLEEGKLTRLSFVNQWAEEIERGDCKTFRWRSRDGKIVEGIVYYPANFDPSRKYPLLVQLHGGPESSYRKYFSTSWATYTYFWTGRGYVVFQPNYRGSTGYGDDVMRSIIGHYFEKDIDDIITGIRALEKRGWVGKKAVMGWSAGGHLTNWLITHFKIFSAASSGAGMSNWFSFYAQTDMRFIREIWHKGPPYERTSYYIKKSPIFYVKNAVTPTIIFCGEKDERVPLPQSREMYFGLKWKGVPTELIVFPGEPHGLRKPAHQLYKMEKEYRWIERYIR